MYNAEIPASVEDFSFSVLPLKEALLNNLATLKYTDMTPVQAQSLPIILKGQDLIVQAKTGSGKTAAFGLAILNSVKIEHRKVQALILCPTRELADQVTQVLRQLARMMPNVRVLNVSGGMPTKPQVDALSCGVHIVVGTPGRVLKHLSTGKLCIDQLQTLVLDEADRMLDMGFFDDIADIIKQCPKQRQTLLFSATFPEEIKILATKFMQTPQKIQVEDLDKERAIKQIFYEVSSQSRKFTLLKALLSQHQPISTLIFCNTKLQASEIAAALEDEGFSAIALHGDMEQKDRDVTIIRFKNQSCSILVATDVAARGLDIKELPAVINYELAHDYDTHVHRIGRTGRAGNDGLAISIVSPSDAQRFDIIEENTPSAILWGDTDDLYRVNNKVFFPEMVTLCLNMGRKDKIRPGDILGALTKDAGLPGDKIGKIDITPFYSYVAVHKSIADMATSYFKEGKLKGRKVNLISMKKYY